MHIMHAYVYVISLMLGMGLIGMLVPLAKSGCMTSMQHSGGATASMMKLVQSSAAASMSFAFAMISGASFLPIAILLLVIAFGISAVSIVYK